MVRLGSIRTARVAGGVVLVVLVAAAVYASAIAVVNFSRIGV